MKNILIVVSSLLLVGLVFAACTTSRAGYESAAFTGVKADGDFELRDYPALTVASTAMDPEKKERDQRFMRLFRYIDGNNQASQKVAMTTPVFMTAEKSAAKMNFVVPAGVAASGAPAPKADDVTIETLPARRCAVLRFSGVTSPAMEAEKLARLRAWMEKEKLVAAGEPFFAYYDPPWTPGPMRRNEVLVPVRK